MAILCVRLLTEWCQDRPEGCEWVHGTVPRSQAGPPDGHPATAGSRGQSGDQVRNLVLLLHDSESTHALWLFFHLSLHKIAYPFMANVTQSEP